ncbi:MAG TPA: hypothetical protein V6D20_10735 [Candidatus Obscuribacterales bacterium]
MSAVLKPRDHDRGGRSPAGRQRRGRQDNGVRSLHESWPTRSAGSSQSSSPTPAAHPATVRVLPKRSLPLWLRGLILAQQGSAVVMLTLVASVLGVYGWTVYVQQNWGRAYHQLETLQRQQQQMTAALEMLKYQTAQSIDQQGSEYQVPHPDQLIFMAPADGRPAHEPSKTLAPPPTTRPPLGY